MAVRRPKASLDQAPIEAAEDVANKRQEIALLMRESIEELFTLKAAAYHLSRITGYKRNYVSHSMNLKIPSRAFLVEAVRGMLSHINGIRDHLADIEGRLRRILELLHDSRVSAKKNFPNGGEAIRPHPLDHLAALVRPEAEHWKRGLGPSDPARLPTQAPHFSIGLSRQALAQKRRRET